MWYKMNKIISVSIPEEMLNDLKSDAKKELMNVSEFVRMLYQEWSTFPNEGGLNEEELNKQKEIAIGDQDFVLAAKLRDQSDRLRMKKKNRNVA